jgi:DNA-binding NtrC family response regulator
MNNRILIIDDETDFCLIMKSYFLKRKYDVSLAFTLTEGLSMIQEKKPDILFLDNNLPDGQGWDSVDDIVEKNPHMKVYLISAHQGKAHVTNTSENIIVWEKPISIEDLNSTFQPVS